MFGNARQTTSVNEFADPAEPEPAQSRLSTSLRVSACGFRITSVTHFMKRLMLRNLGLAEKKMGIGIVAVLGVLPVSAVRVQPMTLNHFKIRFSWGRIGPYRT